MNRILAMALSVLLLPMTFAAAAEPEPTETPVININNIINRIDENGIDYSTYNAFRSDFSYESFQKLDYAIPDAGLDIGRLHESYFILSDRIDALGYGEAYTLKEYEFHSRYSTDLTATFQQKFGFSPTDTWNNFRGASVSSSFRNAATGMLNSMKSERDSALSDIKSSAQYTGAVSAFNNTNKKIDDIHKTVETMRTLSPEDRAGQLIGKATNALATLAQSDKVVSLYTSLEIAKQKRYNEMIAMYTGEHSNPEMARQLAVRVMTDTNAIDGLTLEQNEWVKWIMEEAGYDSDDAKDYVTNHCCYMYDEKGVPVLIQKNQDYISAVSDVAKEVYGQNCSVEQLGYAEKIVQELYYYDTETKKFQCTSRAALAFGEYAYSGESSAMYEYNFVNPYRLEDANANIVPGMKNALETGDIEAFIVYLDIVYYSSDDGFASYGTESSGDSVYSGYADKYVPSTPPKTTEELAKLEGTELENAVSGVCDSRTTVSEYGTGTSSGGVFEDIAGYGSEEGEG